MAVFTQLDAACVNEALEEFSLGRCVSLEPISSGIENTNYFLDTDTGRWVLTVFERLQPEQLPFYLELCEHLRKHGCPVAAPQRTKKGALFSFIKGKPFSIANRLAGTSIADVTPVECASMGRTLARMHLAARDFALHQPNLRGFLWCRKTAPLIAPHVPAALYAKLDEEIHHQQTVFESDAYRSLTVTACHCDLFRNNTMIGEHGTEAAHVCGVFDFYFAGCSPWLFDLAVVVNDWCIIPETGALDTVRVKALMDAYHAERRLTATEKSLWRDMLRAGALRFWTSRLFDYYLPREAALLTPHDPTHFERVLDDRRVCPLYWPQA